MKKQKISFLVLAVLFVLSNSTILSAQKKGKTPKVVKTGENLKCGFVPKTDSTFDNFLRIKVSSRTEVLVKLVDVKTDSTIRMAFINSSDTYDIKYIPAGKYYIKVAMGKEWVFQDSSKCAGSFKQIPIYKKIDRKFAFKKKSNGVDDYILELDETTNGNKAIKDAFITEKEFNK
jgi:hypothetical protein